MSSRSGDWYTSATSGLRHERRAAVESDEEEEEEEAEGVGATEVSKGVGSTADARPRTSRVGHTTRPASGLVDDLRSDMISMAFPDQNLRSRAL